MLFGVIKEVAPCPGAASDKVLGLGEFQSRYYPFPLFLDSDKRFYSALGNRSLLSTISWNPFTWISLLSKLSSRLESKGISGNYAGEGLLLGGVVIVCPRKGVVYTYQEKTGSEMPLDEIIEVLQDL
jgi:hypothetical protein